MNRVILSLLVFLLFPLPLTSFSTSPVYLHGSTVVAIRTAEGVFIGADSKGVRSGVSGQSEQVCKIGVVNNLVFAHAGLIEDPTSGFSVPKEARAACVYPGRLIDKVNQFEKSVLPSVESIVQSIHQKHRAFFDIYIKDSFVIEIIFGGVEDGSTILYTHSFKVSVNSSNSVSVNVVRDECKQNCYKLIPIGETDAIQKEIRKYKTKWQANPIQTLRNLIKLEIEKEPELVGPPISMIQIKSSGIDWINQPGACRK